MMYNINTLRSELTSEVKNNLPHVVSDRHREYMNELSLNICVNKLEKIIVATSNSAERNELIKTVMKIVDDFGLLPKNLDYVYKIIGTKNFYEVIKTQELIDMRGNQVSLKSTVEAAYTLSAALVETVSRNDMLNTEYLLEMGIKPINTREGYSALHVATARHVNMLQKILDYAPDYVNIPTAMNKLTPLHTAASGKSLPNVLCLLQHKADPSLPDVNGKIIKLKYDDTILSAQIYSVLNQLQDFELLQSIMESMPETPLPLKFLAASTVKSLTSDPDVLPLPAPIIHSLHQEYYPIDSDPVEIMGHQSFVHLLS